MKQLDVYIDFRSPAAYLAVQPTLQLQAEVNCRVSWRPFLTRQRAALVEQPGESKSETHFRVRDKYRRRTWRLYAEVQDIEMNFPAQPGECDLAMRALLGLEGEQIDFVTAAFDAYWVDGKDLNDPEVVAQLLTATESQVVEQERLDVALLAAQEVGVVDVPCYIIDEQRFIGREHLPWIKHLLG